MILIEECEKLRKLEQQATYAPWETEENEGGHEIRMGKAISSRGQYPTHCIIEYEHGCFEDDENDPPANNQAAEAEANAYMISKMRNLAPTMLEVLGCFREGDAEHLRLVRELVERLTKGSVGWDEEIEVLSRVVKVAALMEQDRHVA